MDFNIHISPFQQRVLQDFLADGGMLLKHPNGQYMLVNSMGAYMGATLNEAIENVKLGKPHE